MFTLTLRSWNRSSSPSPSPLVSCIFCAAVGGMGKIRRPALSRAAARSQRCFRALYRFMLPAARHLLLAPPLTCPVCGVGVFTSNLEFGCSRGRPRFLSNEGVHGSASYAEHTGCAPPSVSLNAHGPDHSGAACARSTLTYQPKTGSLPPRTSSAHAATDVRADCERGAKGCLATTSSPESRQEPRCVSAHPRPQGTTRCDAHATPPGQVTLQHAGLAFNLLDSCFRKGTGRRLLRNVFPYD